MSGKMSTTIRGSLTRGSLTWRIGVVHGRRYSSSSMVLLFSLGNSTFLGPLQLVSRSSFLYGMDQ